MRVCRFQRNSDVEFGFYTADAVVPIADAAAAMGKECPAITSLLELLPKGEHFDFASKLAADLTDGVIDKLTIAESDLKLLVPIPNPSKIMLLAGNYAKHIEEGGGKAEERKKTFPYVFMKPPSTTLTNPGDPIKIPDCSPNQIDWELELGVVIGKRCKNVSEDEALDYVAGYTVVNDVSDRAFHPNPERAERPKDVFFDWLHGKWHDTFCPMGPCILAASDDFDPQNLKMQLKVNGEVEQDSSTAEMVFPVAAIIEFISSYVTLEPGDIISTGTPAGVGKAKGKFLRVGGTVEAYIEKIGRLENPVA